MTNLPKNLPDLLRKAGLTVVEIDDWETRGRPASTGGFAPVGVLNHHTGSRDVVGDDADDLTYAKWLFTQGRDDLPAPLCHLAISCEGTVYLGAAGRANHAGEAKSSGSIAAGDGNTLYVGIEWMLSGTQPIPAEMYETGVKTNAVLLDILGSSEQAASCHYQTSTTGKWDIGDPNGVLFRGHKVLDVRKFRAAIKAYRQSEVHMFKAVTWNVYAGSKPDALEPHLIREMNIGVSLFFMQEAGARGITPMLERHGLETYVHGQWRLAWDPEVWPRLLESGHARLSDAEFFSPHRKTWGPTECAMVTLEHRSGKTLEALSYHTPSHVQVRGSDGKLTNRQKVTWQAHVRIGEIAKASKADGFLAAGDDNFDEDSGWLKPMALVREILLGRKTGLLQLQAGQPTFGKREIDDFRILRGGNLRPIGDPWVHEGGGEEKPNHEQHGRKFGWK